MKHLILNSAMILGLLMGSGVYASPEPSNPDRQTPWHLYMDAKETYDFKMKMGDKALLVDVRDPIEIHFVGFTDVADINIPFKLANRHKWNEKKSLLAMEKNPSFEDDMEKALAERGLDKNAPVIIMCRSGGTRGAPAARTLYDRGFKQVYVMTDGFEGGKVKSGEKKNWRLVNGWKNSGLPWSYKMNPDKMYYREEF